MRRAGTVSMLVLFVVAVACGEAPKPDAVAADLLYFQTAKGVSVVAAGAETAPPRTPGVPSTDWSSVVTADPGKHATHVKAHDAVTGETQWKTSIEGPRLRVKVVSHGASMVALTPMYQGHYTGGREKTTMVVAGRGAEPRTITLDGNYEPEAFSTDGNSAFLLQYLPPKAPDSYRVRRLDLTTEKVTGVYSVDAELQEAMRGTARIQTMSPDGRFLYTLYTTGGGNLGPRRAFIHVLSLDELWAHCIDLPSEFGQSREANIAVTVTPDAKRLFVTDSGTGAVSEVDTKSLEVLATETTDLFSQYRPIAAHDGRHTLFVAQGPFLSTVDTRDMSEGDSWILDSRIRGLQVSADGSKVYAALRRGLTTIDVTKSGDEPKVTKPPGVGRITEMGRVMRKIEEPLSKLTCAC